ncbi:3-dehydroquinate synthase [Pontibacillus yanchengensis]|uniref:3-dehydroquinate synthase n=1 Tax=Pontibacillus yanchengensis Y32 TaxID=1385514 RepID=A0A0A2TBS6_9BACI|nr:3-dehydroquinate synthase [Pontibacillus yanchengensis]KGP73014.1 3-dehydroquinate synthase [Pontibacillus yanchengensis Y32]
MRVEQLPVQTNTGNYNVYIGKGLRHQVETYLPKQYNQVFIITDSHIANMYLNDVVDSFSSEVKVSTYTVPAGENSKQMDWFHECHTYAIESGLERSDLIVALGGGVVGDLAGFVAATYMRGVDYIQVPTTILAHDSSVGGKVAINHPQGKNMIGSFHQPQAVIYDTETLDTLPGTEWRSGMAEVIKHALIADEEMLEQCFDLPSFDAISNETIADLLKKGIHIKASIVQEDEKEKGVRRYLNLGHTLGHAIEAESGYSSITHGEAVAIGIDFALFLSAKQFPEANLPNEAFRKWLEKHNYPLSSKLEEYNLDALMEKIKKDKKNNHQQIRIVLLSSIGEPTLVPYSEQSLMAELIEFRNEVRNS